jgi:hypothetical protein
MVRGCERLCSSLSCWIVRRTSPEKDLAGESSWGRIDRVGGAVTRGMLPALYAMRWSGLNRPVVVRRAFVPD